MKEQVQFKFKTFLERKGEALLKLIKLRKNLIPKRKKENQDGKPNIND